MKKITLALLTAFFITGTVFSQPITSIQAPLYDGSNSSLSVASGSADAVYHRSCWLVLASELTPLALTNSIVTAFGIDYFQGTNAATVGQFTVYLQNTGDVGYTKGTNWAGCLAGMGAPYYVGTWNIPVTNGFTTVTVPLGTNFPYGGGGVYVAIDWYSAGASATQWARAQCNTTGLATVGGVRGVAPSAGPAPTTLSTTPFRPSFRFNAANSATNEVSVVAMQALGQASKLAGGQVVNATIRNNSSVALNNVSVTLNVSGANSFNNIQTVTSIGSGSLASVNFNFNPLNNGINTLSASVLSDQNNSNNSSTLTQSVNCNIIAISPVLPVGSFTSLCYNAGTGGGIVAFKYISGPAASSIAGVRGVVPSFSNAANAGNALFAVLCDGAGAILSQGNPVTLTTANMDVLTTFNFTAPQNLSANTDYYVGLGSTTSANFPFGTSTAANILYGHYRIPLTGGTPVLTDLDNLSLSAALNFSSTTISAIASKTVVCKKDGPLTVTLTASGGASTYTWSPGGAGPVVVVSPTVASTNGGVVVYNVTGTDGPTGCKSNVASIQVSVSVCSALATIDSDGFDIKLFPNPTINGKCSITGLVGTNAITVMNTLGQVILMKTISEETLSLDLSAQPAGNYLVKITNSENVSRMVKFVNQN